MVGVLAGAPIIQQVIPHRRQCQDLIEFALRQQVRIGRDLRPMKLQL